MPTDFVFWDVQHGSASYIRTPNNRHIVVDLGAGKLENGAADFSPLTHLRNSWGVERVDSLIVTHPHEDHLDDIFALSPLPLSMFTRPTHLSEADVRANNDNPGPALDKYFELSDSITGRIDSSNDMHASHNTGGLSLEHFFPRASSKSNLNNHSIVSVASYSGFKILIPGDNEAASWKELLEDRNFVNSVQGTDVLVAPHHGRESGFSPELFNHISPRLTVVSDGPAGSTSVTDRYSARSSGAKVEKRSGGSDTKKCVTTRSNGVVSIRVEDSGDWWVHIN